MRQMKRTCSPSHYGSPRAYGKFSSTSLCLAGIGPSASACSSHTCVAADCQPMRHRRDLVSSVAALTMHRRVSDSHHPGSSGALVVGWDRCAHQHQVRLVLPRH